MSLTRRALGSISAAVAAARARSRPSLRVLMYHAVSSERYDRYGSSVAPDAFRSQIRWLREDSGLRLVALKEGVEMLGNRDAAGEVAVTLTFDDGYMDALTEAAPLLHSYSIPFTVFVIGSFLTQPPAMHRFLDVQAARELASVPEASLGAHGYSHEPLTDFDDDALAEDLKRSGDELAGVSGTRPVLLSYPHGAVNRRVVHYARQAGFTVGATSLAGMNHARVRPLLLRRTEVWGRDTLSDFVAKVRGGHDWYRFKQRVYTPGVKKANRLTS